MRFVLGVVLVVGCLMWMHGNGLLPSSTNLDDDATYRSIWERAMDAKTLRVPLVPVPEVVLNALSTLNAGVAGILLILSAIWRSWKIGLLQVVAAAIMVVGPVMDFPTLLCLGAGVGLSVLGFVVGRDT